MGRVSARQWAGVLGVAAGWVVWGLHASGWLQGLELMSLDLRLRYFCRPPVAGDRIAVIGIDDPALYRYGQWPWHRARTGALIGELRRLGAEAVVVDLLLNKPRAVRVELPELGENARLERARGALPGSVDLLRVGVDDDGVLAGILQRSGRVILAMNFDFPPREGAEQARRESARWLAAVDAYRRSRQGWPRGAEDLAEWLGASERGPEQFAEALGLYAQRRAAAALLAGVDGFPAFAQQELSGEQAGEESWLRQELRIAWRVQRSLQRMRERGLLHASGPGGRPGWVPEPALFEPPLPEFVEQAMGIGFVVVADQEGGVFRSLPMVAGGEGSELHMGLALATARAVLGWPAGAIGVEAVAGLRLVDGSGRRWRLGLDDRGQALIAWPRAERWDLAFPTHAAGAFMELVVWAEQLESNRRLRAEAVHEALARFRPRQGLEQEWAAVDLALVLQSRGEQVPAERAPRGFPTGAEALEQQAWLQERARELEGLAVEAAGLQAMLIAEQLDEEGLSEEQRAELAALAAKTGLAAKLGHLDVLDRGLQAAIEAGRERLAPLVGGRVCFLGCVGTGNADFVVSPAYPGQTPGVVAHAAMYNQLLQGFGLRWPVGWVDALVILFSAGFGTLSVLRMSAVRAALLSVVGGLGMTGVVLAAFWVWGQWVAMAGPVLSLGAAHAVAGTILLRTEGRQKRLYAAYFSQYTDPVLARKIAEDPGLIERVEEREISVFFSDLAGFTSISERLGGKRTQEVLNLYFERMGVVLRSEGAMINKYMGDGAMVFFNPTVNPQPDHALRALRSVIACVEACDRLNREQAAADAAWPRLLMRVGLASGQAIVGNLGSREKTDYTCISDVVNFAARLEPANKIFGTQILLSEGTARLVEGEYLCRPLGRLRAVGKEACVAIYEPLGLRAELADSAGQHAELWRRFFELYYARRFDDGLQLLLHIREHWPGDTAAGIYMGLCLQHESEPPEEGWQGEYVQSSK